MSYKEKLARNEKLKRILMRNFFKKWKNSQNFNEKVEKLDSSSGIEDIISSFRFVSSFPF